MKILFITNKKYLKDTVMQKQYGLCSEFSFNIMILKTSWM